MLCIKSDDGFWSNEEGWVESKKEATRFSPSEQKEFEYYLPLGNNVHWTN